MPSRESQHDKERIDVAGPTALGDAVSATRRYASDRGLGARDSARICIIVEELITNLLEHGQSNDDPRIGIEIGRNATSLTLLIEDNGPVFDPRVAPKAADMPIRGGGAGLRLVSAWSDVVGYQTSQGQNRLELIMPLTEV